MSRSTRYFQYRHGDDYQEFLEKFELVEPSRTNSWDEEWVFEQLLGRTIVEIEGGSQYDDELILYFLDGLVVKFHHEQDCCETVQIEDIVGDLDDLLGSPLTECERVSNDEQDVKPHEYAESWTWTFYKFATRRGFVTVRWLGESNGYYGESVDVILGEQI